MDRYLMMCLLTLLLFLPHWLVAFNSVNVQSGLHPERVVVATRIHSNQGESQVDPGSVLRWAENVLTYTNTLLIATDHFLVDELRAALAPLHDKVHVVLVSPWKGYTLPLNALLLEAASLGVSQILFQSAEVNSTAADLRQLQAHFDEKTLVVGAKMTAAHGDVSGWQPLDGLNAPWNTMALWDVNKLGMTGFIQVSDGLAGAIPGGMEEVATLSLLQYLYPDNMQAKLVKLTALDWQTDWQDPKRQSRHAEKMASKRSRAERQLSYLQLPRGRVFVF